MNIIQALDFYKTGHAAQYPDGSEFVYSNLTPRSVKYSQVPRITVFSIQRFIIKRLIEDFDREFFNKPRAKVIKRYQRRMNNALGPNVVSAKNIENLHKLGYLPLRIKALPEGVSVLPKVPVMTVVNTLPEFFWVTNYIETMLSCEVWQPMTNMSVARAYLEICERFAKETGTPLEFTKWQGHDFSMRGMAGIEAAAASGAAHLAAGFYGTDTVLAIDELEDYYGANSDTEMVGGSVVATEHAVMCMGGKDTEVETFRRLIRKNPYGILSIVSDTWDLWKVLTEYAVELKDEIQARKPVLDPEGNVIAPGKLVFRPDSGDPVKILTGYKVVDFDADIDLDDLWNDGIEAVRNPLTGKIKVLEVQQVCGLPTAVPGRELSEHEVKGAVELLWENFPGSINEAGYKQLEEVGTIYGDSITLERAEQILQRLKDKGFASGNVVLGIGSYTYQYNTRDTLGMAVKATHGIINGESVEIFKDPVTDDGTKKSATGLLRVEKEDGEYVLYDRQTPEQEAQGCLELVFENGKLHRLQTLEQIRRLR